MTIVIALCYSTEMALYTIMYRLISFIVNEIPLESIYSPLSYGQVEVPSIASGSNAWLLGKYHGPTANLTLDIEKVLE